MIKDYNAQMVIDNEIVTLHQGLLHSQKLKFVKGFQRKTK